MTGTTAHGRASEYLDGALVAGEEADFLDHVAVCTECQTELHSEVQLRDREDALRGAGASPEHAVHGRGSDYLDGTLGSECEAAFLDHVATCQKCQRDLHVEVQRRDREDELRSAHAVRRAEVLEVPPTPLVDRDDALRDAGVPTSRSSSSARAGVAPTPRWRRARSWGGASLALTAAAIALLVARPPHSKPSEHPALALNPSRGLEIRLSHAVAATHRPYDTMRSSATLAEPIPPTVIAQLDAAGDCQGVAAAYVLAGELVRADDRYRRCPAGTDVDADRAGLAVLRGQPDIAIELTERVLEAKPDHTVALWNRALALRALGLELSAGAAFEQVAALDHPRKPEWAREASERASAMHDIERMRNAYADVMRLGTEMGKGGAPLAVTLALQAPARARVMLHDAIRTAATPERLDELAPLAVALERRLGGDLRRYLVQARARLSRERAAASAEYITIVERDTLGDNEWASWLALATRAKDDDMILGARILTGRLDGKPSAEQLAAGTRDPWFERAIDLLRADQALAAGRVEDYAARLAAIEPHCPAGATSYRCLQLAIALANLELARHRPTDALPHALAAAAISHQLGEWQQRFQALMKAGDAHRLGGNFALASNYYEESRRSVEACGQVRNAVFATAEMQFQNHQLARAHSLAAAAPACDEVPGVVELTMLVRLLRSKHAVLDRASLIAAIAKARSAPSRARYAAYLDYLAELVWLDEDPAARGRLSRVAESASSLEGSTGDKTIVAVSTALFADSGRRGQWAEAIDVVARHFGVEAPARCALAFGADDMRFASVAVGPDGTHVGRYEPDVARTSTWLAPEPMRRQLDGCDEIAVLALPPWLGIGPVLDVQTPWHYVLGPARSPIRGRHDHVVIADPIPPQSAGLAPLAPRVWSAPSSGGELITGAAATPERVLAAISDATLVEIHSHATWLDRLDAPVLALSPGQDGWTLGAAKIRNAKLTGAPVIVLADCAGGAAAKFEHEAWGLPLAFRTAGARAVIASLAEIPDREAMDVFGSVTAEIGRGSSPATAVALIRAEKIRADPTSWMRNIVVFQ